MNVEVVSSGGEVHCVESLLILAPADVPDKCGIIPDHSLAASVQTEAVVLVLQPGGGYRLAKDSTEITLANCRNYEVAPRRDATATGEA